MQIKSSPTTSNFSKMLYINFNITTSNDCVADLEAVTIILNPESNLTFMGNYWGDLSLKPSIIIEQKQNILYVSKISNVKYIFVYFALERLHKKYFTFFLSILG